MALVRTNLIGVMSAAAVGTASFTTAAATTSSGQFLVVIGWADSGTSVTAANLTISDSLANSYTSQMTLDFNPGVDMAFRVWTAPVTTTGSTTWTIDCGADSTDTFSVMVLGYTGADTTGLGTTGSMTAGPLDGAASFTLAANPATTSEVIAFWGCDINTGLPTQTPGSTFTELYNVGVSGHAIFEVEVRTGSTSTTVDLVDINDTAGPSVGSSAALAVEVKAAATGGFDVPDLHPPFPIVNQAVYRM